MPGLFITFEGIDSAGKKTQIQLLANTLRNLGREVATISFPSYETEIGKLIKNWLSRSLTLNPETASMLYAADRTQYQERIKEWLRKNWIVITDRYCYSNIAYQSALGLSKEWLIEIEKPIIKPDIIFLLNIPVVTATDRGTNQESLQRFLDMEEEKPKETLGQKVSRIFLELSENPPYDKKWYVIDGTKPVEEIQATIWNTVQGKLT
jgi:dTMP kinase